MKVGSLYSALAQCPGARNEAGGGALALMWHAGVYMHYNVNLLPTPEITLKGRAERTRQAALLWNLRWLGGQETGTFLHHPVCIRLIAHAWLQCVSFIAFPCLCYYLVSDCLFTLPSVYFETTFIFHVCCVVFGVSEIGVNCEKHFVLYEEAHLCWARRWQVVQLIWHAFLSLAAVILVGRERALVCYCCALSHAHTSADLLIRSGSYKAGVQFALPCALALLWYGLCSINHRYNGS